MRSIANSIYISRSCEKYPRSVFFSVGEPQESERSVSSTKPYTVNLYADAQEFSAPVVQIAPARDTRTALNSSTSNPDYSGAAPAASFSGNDIIT